MEEKNSPYSTRESFISELAVAMSVYNICEDQYLNLTQQNLLFVQRENTVWDEKWPAEGDEVILVDRISSREAFDQMVEFIDSIEDGQAPYAKELFTCGNQSNRVVCEFGVVCIGNLNTDAPSLSELGLEFTYGLVATYC